MLSVISPRTYSTPNFTPVMEATPYWSELNERFVEKIEPLLLVVEADWNQPVGPAFKLEHLIQV